MLCKNKISKVNTAAIFVAVMSGIIFSVSTLQARETIQTKKIEDFTRFVNEAELNAPCWTTIQSKGIKLDLELVEQPVPDVKKAMKLTFGKASEPQPGFDLGINLLNTDLRMPDGIRFWAKNLDKSECFIGIYLKEGTGEEWISGKNQCKYSLVKNGNTRIYQTGSANQEIVIPSQFEGYVEIPIDQFELVRKSKLNGRFDLNDVASFHICGDKTNQNGGCLLVSNIEAYGKNANADFVVGQPDLASAEIVKASDFGLSENSPDNTYAFMDAVNYSRQFKSSIIEIPKGTYRFSNTHDIDIDSVKNICVNGNNSEFIFSDYGFFRLNNSNHVLLKNIIVDWDWGKDRLASLVRVVNIGKDYKFIEFEFPELEQVDTTIVFLTMNQFDPVTLTPGTESGKEYWKNSLLYSRIEKTAKPNHLRVYPRKGSFFDMLKGEVFLVRHKPRAKELFGIVDSKHVTFQGITVYSAPGACFLLNGETHHVKIDSCKICLRPGSNRRMSTEADGFHVAQSKGYLIIEDSDFSYMGDDDVNIHDNIGFVANRIDDHSLQLANDYMANKGDFFEVRKPDFSKTGDILELAKVEKTGNGCKMVFKDIIPQYITENYLLQSTKYNSSNYVIRNNYFHHNRARGLLLQCSNGIVENNTIERTQGAAIYVMMETLKNLWYEGRGVDNLVVRNNKFINCNVNDWTSVIDIMAVLPDKESTFPVFTNLVFENNYFKEFPSSVFYINKARNVTIEGNKFESVLPRKTNRPDRGSFYINRSSDINIRNNTWVPSPFIPNPGNVITDPSGDGKRPSYSLD